MDDWNNELSQIRRKIDEIDTALHDLLMQRAEMAVAAGKAKSHLKAAKIAALPPVITTLPDRSFAEAAVFIRQAREAEILRRLIRRHHGPLPKTVILRIWRELIAATLQIECALSIAVHVPKNRPNMRDVARDHFGSSVKMMALPRAAQVVDCVRQGQVTLGILPAPYPEDDEDDRWWPLLADRKEGTLPHIMDRLPFGNIGGKGDLKNAAFALSYAPYEISGEDTTLIIVEGLPKVDPQSIAKALNDGLATASLLATEGSLGLVELEGAWAGKEKAILEHLDGLVSHLSVIGLYATSLSDADFKDDKK